LGAVLKILIKNHGIWLQILFSSDEVFELNCEHPEIAERLSTKLNKKLSDYEKVATALKQLLQIQAYRGDRIPLRDPQVNEWFSLAREVEEEGLI
jgi:hypothetical protein